MCPPPTAKSDASPPRAPSRRSARRPARGGDSRTK
ncbi:hypothetical protein PC116_g33322 [Phytophthora cactorum]|nr:hypothetical protein PC116_g33322 [Phytophthora cactorum]